MYYREVNADHDRGIQTSKWRKPELRCDPVIAKLKHLTLIKQSLWR